jgi:hypothetical protein
MKNVCGADYKPVRISCVGNAQMDLWLRLWLYASYDLWYQWGPEIIFHIFIVVQIKPTMEKTSQVLCSLVALSIITEHFRRSPLFMSAV